MFDAEIYKALECCTKKDYWGENKCGECPFKKYSIYGCKGVMLKDTLHNFGRLMREVNEMRDILEQRGGINGGK